MSPGELEGARRVTPHRRSQYNPGERMKAAGRKSRYWGVWWDDGRGRWAAGAYEVEPRRRTVRIAHFQSETEAAVAHDRVALHSHGTAAPRNFPRRSLAPASIEDIRREQRCLTKSERTSRWLGVYLLRGGQPSRAWAATIHLPSGPDLSLGNWSTERQAAVAYDRAARHYVGARAEVNFPKLRTRCPPADAGVLRAEAERERKTATSSRFRGVIWVRSLDRWRARITFDGTLHHLGLYSDEREAGRAYDKTAREVFGDKAKLNFRR
jgi:hypothetical protein